MNWSFIFCALLLVSCQGSKAAAEKSNGRIVEHANEGRQDLRKARPFVSEEGVEHLDSADGHFLDITQESTEKLGPNLAKLKDPEGLWSKVWGWAKRLFYVLLAIALLLAAGQWGVIPQLAGLVGWLAKMGLSVSRKAVHEAALAVDVLYKDGDNSPATKQLIAVKRSTDPSFNGAFIREKAKFKG